MKILKGRTVSRKGWKHSALKVSAFSTKTFSFGYCSITSHSKQPIPETHSRTHIRTHTHTYTDTHIHIHTDTHILSLSLSATLLTYLSFSLAQTHFFFFSLSLWHTQTQTSIVFPHISTHPHTRTHTRTHAHTHIYTHTHAHTRSHTHTQSHNGKNWRWDKMIFFGRLQSIREIGKYILVLLVVLLLLLLGNWCCCNNSERKTYHFQIHSWFDVCEIFLWIAFLAMSLSGDLVSISSTFYEQLLHVQIPKA